MIGQIYTCWFSEAYGYKPVRIEISVSYQYDGKEHPYERAADRERLLVYETGDFQRFGNDDVPWFPTSGSKPHYLGDPGGTAPFNPDTLADVLVADGEFVADGDDVFSKSRGWRILKQEKIPTSMET